MDHVAETTGEIISQYANAARLIATATAFASAMQRLEGLRRFDPTAR